MRAGSGWMVMGVQCPASAPFRTPRSQTQSFLLAKDHLESSPGGGLVLLFYSEGGQGLSPGEAFQSTLLSGQWILINVGVEQPESELKVSLLVSRKP